MQTITLKQYLSIKCRNTLYEVRICNRIINAIKLKSFLDINFGLTKWTTSNILKYVNRYKTYYVDEKEIINHLNFLRDMDIIILNVFGELKKKYYTLNREFKVMVKL